MYIGQESQCGNEIVESRGLFPMSSVQFHKGFPKGEDDKEVYVSKIGLGDMNGWILVKLFKIWHKGFLIKEMKYLTAVKLDCVNQVDSVIVTWHHGRFWKWASPSPIPTKVVCGTVKEKLFDGDRGRVNMLVDEIQHSAAERPVGGCAKVNLKAQGLVPQQVSRSYQDGS